MSDFTEKRVTLQMFTLKESDPSKGKMWKIYLALSRCSNRKAPISHVLSSEKSAKIVAFQYTIFMGMLP